MLRSLLLTLLPLTACAATPPASGLACDDPRPLVEARSAEEVQCAVEAGADVNAVVDEDDGTTLLHAMVARGSAEVVQALLDAGADVNARDTDGLTPLLVAAGYGGSPVETIQALLDAGADLHATDEAGNTALHWASRWDATDTAALLLDAGADPNAVMEMFGYTALHSAFLFSVEAATVPLLLEAGADPRAVTGDGRTVLNTAEEMIGSEYVDQDAALAVLREALGE